MPEHTHKHAKAYIFYIQTELPTKKSPYLQQLSIKHFVSTFDQRGIHVPTVSLYFAFVNMDLRWPLCLVCLKCFPIYSWLVLRKKSKETSQWVCYKLTTTQDSHKSEHNGYSVHFQAKSDTQNRTAKKIAKQTATPDRVITWPAQRQRAKVTLERMQTIMQTGLAVRKILCLRISCFLIYNHIQRFCLYKLGRRGKCIRVHP